MVMPSTMFYADMLQLSFFLSNELYLFCADSMIRLEYWRDERWLTSWLEIQMKSSLLGQKRLIRSSY